MNFFIPATSDINSILDVYNGVKKFMQSQGFDPLPDKLVYSIDYTHNGKKENATIDKFHVVNNQRVLIIFECKELFLVCTPSRGVLGGDPILVGRHNVENVVYFDSFPIQ